MTPPSNPNPRLAFLSRVFGKRCRHLFATDQRLFDQPCSAARAGQLEANPDRAERVEAFVGRALIVVPAAPGSAGVPPALFPAAGETPALPGTRSTPTLVGTTIKAGGRFGRLQDTVGDKFLPALLAALDETPGSAINNLDGAERLGWVDSADTWMAMRRLRNQVIHEYVEDPALLTSALETAHHCVAAHCHRGAVGKRGPRLRLGRIDRAPAAFHAPLALLTSSGLHGPCAGRRCGLGRANVRCATRRRPQGRGGQSAFRPRRTAGRWPRKRWPSWGSIELSTDPRAVENVVCPRFISRFISIDQRNLADLVAKTERHPARKIRPLVLTAEEYAALATTLIAKPHLVLWTADGQGRTSGDTAGISRQQTP